jgi:hypothetical protein
MPDSLDTDLRTPEAAMKSAAEIRREGITSCAIFALFIFCFFGLSYLVLTDTHSYSYTPITPAETPEQTEATLNEICTEKEGFFVKTDAGHLCLSSAAILFSIEDLTSEGAREIARTHTSPDT